MLPLRVLLIAALVATLSYALSLDYQRIHIKRPVIATTRCTTSQRSTRCHQSLSMGLDVRIRMVGRKNGGEAWLESAYKMYDTRLKPSGLSVTTQYHKSDGELIKGVEADEAKNHKVILLDPLGKLCTSEEFSENMYNWLEAGGSRLTFVIGGADGLPPDLKEGRRRLLSLGKLTFTHQWARVLLVEQIYRAAEIRKGSGYHK